MSTASPFIFKSTGVLAFLASTAIGWNLATPSSTQVPTKETLPPTTKHAPRRPPSPRAVAADVAAKRVAAVRAAENPAARMRATIDLANSLPLGDFAAWMDGGWFNLRNGPEMKLFSKILLERWQREDPDGLLAWGLKNGNHEAEKMERDWAAKDPQRLLAFFKSHKDDSRELEILAQIADHSPDLAIQRLREMVAAGMVSQTMVSSQELIGVLAKKSPDALLAILDSLPADVRTWALVAISKLRLATTFSEEIRNLWEHPDGWKIFSRCRSGGEFTDKLLTELANMPPRWRSELSGYPDPWVTAASAQKWWDADLEGAGFSAAEIHRIRRQALERLTESNAEVAFQKMGEIDLTPEERASALANVFNSAGDLERARALIPGLPTEEERKAATLILDQRSKPNQKENFVDMAPADYLATLATGAVPNGGPSSSYLRMLALDATKISALSGGFKELPDDQKQKVAAAFASNNSGLPPHDSLRGDAIRYLLELPQPPVAVAGQEWNGITANCSRYAVSLSQKDPVAACDWVRTLPDGEAKLWAQKNLATNWAQYDPKAADHWLKSLPPETQVQVKNLGK